MRKVVHFEIPAENLDRAKTFYDAVFGWKIETMPVPGGEYTSLTTTPVDEQSFAPTEPGAINGGMMQRSEHTPSPVITIDVEGIDEALKDVEARGGTTVLPRRKCRDGCLRLLQGHRRQRHGLVGDHDLAFPLRVKSVYEHADVPEGPGRLGRVNDEVCGRVRARGHWLAC